MAEVKEWIEQVRRLDPPDLWYRIEARSREPFAAPPPRRPRLTAAGLLVTTAVVIGLVLYSLQGLDSQPEVSAPGAGQIVRYQLASPPQPMSVGEGAAWVSIGAGSGTTNGVVRIDAVTGSQQMVDTPGGDWTAVGGGSVWLLCNSHDCIDKATRELDPTIPNLDTVDGAVIRLDPGTGRILGYTPLLGRGLQIVGAPDGAWVTTDIGVSFIDARATVTRNFSLMGANLIGADRGSLWVGGASNVVSLDPETGGVVAKVAFPDVCTMEVADGTVWVASCGGSALHQGPDRMMGIDADSGQVLFDEPVDGYGQMRYADGVLWLAERSPENENEIRVLAFDPRTGAFLGVPLTIERDLSAPNLGFGNLSGFPPHVFFSVGEDSLWLTDFTVGQVIRAGIPTLSSPTPSPVSSADTSIAAVPSQASDIAAPASELAAAGGYIWAAEDTTNMIEKVDPSTGDAVATIHLDGSPAWLAAGQDVLWVALASGKSETVVGIDPVTDETVITMNGLTGPLTETTEGLWGFEYRAPEPNRMVLLHPQTGAEIRRVEVSSQPFDIAASGGAIWLLDAHSRTVQLIIAGGEPVVVTDRSAGTWLASDTSGVYLSAWRQSSANDQNGPGTSAFAKLDGHVQPFADIYNFRPMVVTADRVWFVAGPHDGDISGLCGMRTTDGVVDRCADISVGLEGVHDPVALDPATGTLWATAWDQPKLYKVNAG